MISCILKYMKHTKVFEKVNTELDNLTTAYSQFSTDENKELNSEFVSYILNQAEDVGFQSEIEVEIKLKKDSSKEEKNRFKKVFANYFNRHTKEVKQDIKHCFVSAAIMMIFAILLITIFYFVPKNYFIFEFVAEIGSWVFAWEAIYIIGFKVPSISHKNYLYKKLLRARINFI